uniref:Actin-fragmin kinase catalytic domain-containing protein n=1 Tax=Haptolina ericina TaxID=156174 RepID=A0A7S3ETZ8_9EUKA
MLADIWPEADGSLSLTDTGGAPDAAPTERKISGLRAPILAVEAGVRLWQPVMELSSLPWHELCRAQPSKPMHINRASSAAININSGGVVFFLLFRRKDAPAPPAAAAPEDDVSRDTPGTPCTSSTGDVGPSPRSPARFMTANGSERACVLKVCDGMSSTHSEFFATQLCTPLGVLAPQTRLLRRSHPDWAKLRAAAAGITGGAEVCAQLDESRNQVVLLQTLIPGKPVLRCAEALTPAGLPATARAFGRMLVLDMLLHNEDRLPCSDLRWRGNAGNILFSESGGGVFAIDTTLPRRPPAFVLEAAKKASMEFLHRLLAPSSDRASEFLREVLTQPDAVTALSAFAGSDRGWPVEIPSSALQPAVTELRAGVVEALGRLGSLHTWLTSLHASLDSSLTSFFAEAEASNEVARLVDGEIPQGKAKGGGGRNSTKSSTFRSAQRQATKAIQRISGAAATDRRIAGPADGKQVAQLREWLHVRVQSARSEIWHSGMDRSIPTGFIDDDVAAGFLPNAFELYIRLAHVVNRTTGMLEAGSRTDEPLDVDTQTAADPRGAGRRGGDAAARQQASSDSSSEKDQAAKRLQAVQRGRILRSDSPHAQSVRAGPSKSGGVGATVADTNYDGGRSRPAPIQVDGRGAAEFDVVPRGAPPPPVWQRVSNSAPPSVLDTSISRIASVKMPWEAFTSAQSDGWKDNQEDPPLTTPTFIEGVKDFFLFNRYARPRGQQSPRPGIQAL